MTHKLVILRHGESQWNHENKFCGWIDIPLSQKGEQEAQFAGQLIKKFGIKPTIMYTSKLTRLIKTGQIILEELDRMWVDTIKTWRLDERHYGAYQGEDKTKVYKQLGAEKYQYVRRNFNAVPPLAPKDSANDASLDERYDNIDIDKQDLPRGESLKLVMERLIPYFDKEIIDHELIKHGRTVLIVTHGSIVRSLIKYLSNVSDDDISKINVPTGVPLVFELDNKGSLTKDYYYLDPELAQKGIEKVKNEGQAV